MTDYINGEVRPKVIIFVRHGQSETNRRGIVSSAVEGYPLTEKGIEQAHRAAGTIASLPRVDAIYSSPVLRARQTAEILGERIGLAPMMDWRLRERWFGQLEDKPEPLDDGSWKLDPKNGLMPWDELRKGMDAFIRESLGKMVVAVTHGDNMSAVCDSMDNKGERLHISSYPGNCRFVIIDAKKQKLIAYDVDSVPKELIGRSSKE